jgi:dihydrofolate reductase
VLGAGLAYSPPRGLTPALAGASIVWVGKVAYNRPMAKLRVSAFSLSIDGYGAGLHQVLQPPLGIAGPELFQWFFRTRTWKRMHGLDGGVTGTDDNLASAAMEGVGAWILGRNMFGPVRGPWPDESWQGWWGDEPPYRTPVFVLTHHARAPLTMRGGTEFRFVTDGIHAALREARAAAGSLDVRVGGGVATVRQYLQAGLIDELHLVIAPVLLGTGEPLLHDINLRSLGYSCHEHTPGDLALSHLILRKGA